MTERITFITCVADPSEYGSCRASIESLEPAGYEVAVAPVDNTTNRYSCAAALNHARERLRGADASPNARPNDPAAQSLLVFCHEDVVFPPDWLHAVRSSIAELEGVEPRWAVLGPMGRRGKAFLGHACDELGEATFFGPLPAAVDSLDELCLIVAADLPLSFDEKLGGYHLYGVDLCIQAHEAGYGCYAIDAPCRHNSTTRHRPPDYHVIKRRLQRKWMFRRRRVGRVIGTTCGRIRFGIFEGWV